MTGAGGRIIDHCFQQFLSLEVVNFHLQDPCYVGEETDAAVGRRIG